MIKSFFCLCLALLFLASCGTNQAIVNNIQERDANEIIVYLASMGIQAEKVQSQQSTGGGGHKVTLWNIIVPPDQTMKAMDYLNKEGLPRKRSESLLEIFGNSSLVPSEMQEKIRYQVGLEQEIANTIRQIDGVIDARVIISFPEKDPLNPEKNLIPVTASVYVKNNGILNDPNAQLVTKIKRLVAASVPDLSYDNVTVIGSTANSTASETWQAPEEQTWENVWSVTVSKNSIFRFRLILFTFLVLIVLLLCFVSWLLWKVSPILKEHGIKELFHLKPLMLSPPPPVQELPLEEEKEPEKKEEPKNFDETG